MLRPVSSSEPHSDMSRWSKERWLCFLTMLMEETIGHPEIEQLVGKILTVSVGGEGDGGQRRGGTPSLSTLGKN